MIKFEFAKFIFKFENNMLPLSFCNYFVDLTKIHKHNTRQKSAGGYYHLSTYIRQWVWEEKITSRMFKGMGSYSSCSKNCSFARFKNNYKSVTLVRYSKDDG